MDVPDPGQHAVQRCLVNEPSGEGGDRRAILAKAGRYRQVFKPRAPFLIKMTLHLDLVFASSREIGLVH